MSVTSPAEITLREKLAAIREVVSYRPGLSVSIVGLSVLLGAMEGIGLGFILPIVTVAQDSTGGDPSGPVAVFVRGYAALGVPFTIEYIIAGVGLVIGVRYGLGVVVAWLTAILGAGYRRQLRLIGYERALTARTAYFDAYGSDELLNALLTQTDYASSIITKLVHGLKTLLVSAAYVLVALAIAPRLFLVTGGALLVALLGSKYLFESGYDVGARLARANERVQTTLQAGIQGIRAVKLFSLESELRADFREAVDQHTRASVKKQRDQTALENLNQFLAAAAVFSLVYLGVSVSSLSLPSLGVFLFAMFRLAPRISSLSGLTYDINNDLPHLVRTHEFLSRLLSNQEAWGDAPAPAAVDHVEFQGVTFGYPTGEAPAVRDISVTIRRGEFTAFVGPSGAGKSTLSALLSGMYRPDSGRILADGTPIDRFAAAGWRSRVAVVKQDPHIFNDTLRYNLTVGNRDASEEAVRTACATAQVTEFVNDLPDGYDTTLGDDGVRLSGGQRQRVALARALLKDADILVLDEATSELDSRLEARVHAGIERLDHEYAVLGIAHRLSTITGADAIHVMEDGEITESGTHDDLVTAGSTYTALYASQTSETGATPAPGADE